jgi:hypothetical protein
MSDFHDFFKTFDINDNNNDQEGTTNMTDNGFAAADFASLTQIKETLTAQRDVALIERDEARARIAAFEAQTVRAQRELASLKSNLQAGLKDWAEANLDSSDGTYTDLHQLMVENGLEGLKREFEVTVRVTYEFTVTVEASDEDEARDEVDNNLTDHVRNNVSLWDSPDDYDIDVEEA